MAVHDEDQMMDTKQAAKLIGVTERTMERMRVAGDGPRYVKISARCIRYTRRSIREWAESKTISKMGEDE